MDGTKRAKRLFSALKLERMFYNPNPLPMVTPMKSTPIPALVFGVERVEPTGSGIVIGGQLSEVNQTHLLEPLLGLLESVETLASVGAHGGQGGPNEENAIRSAYRALYQFFHALLPSASHQALDGLSYSTALLLVGEAIEAGRIVLPSPSPPSRAAMPGRSVQ